MGKKLKSTIIHFYKRYELILLKSVLVIFLALLILTDVNGWLSKNFWGEYIGGTVTEIIGILISLFLIEIIVGRTNRNKEVNNLIIKVKEMNDIMQILFDKYKMYILFIIDPTREKEIDLSKGFEFDFTQVLSVPSFFVYDGGHKKSVEHLFDTKDKINSLLQSFLINMNFKGYHEFDGFKRLLSEYITSVYSYYPKDAILEDMLLATRDKKYKKLIDELLADKKIKKEWLEHSNIATKYVILYKLMNSTIKFIEDYNSEIKNMFEK